MVRQKQTDMNHVSFPCDQHQWPAVKELLTRAQGVQDVPVLCQLLDEIYHTSQAGKTKRETVFKGLEVYLLEVATQAERQAFLDVILPNIIDRAVNIERLKPENGLAYSAQQDASTTRVSRCLAASVLACAFLCLWPNRQGRGSRLSQINFTSFFAPVLTDRRATQTAKLQCILNYFMYTSSQPDGPPGELLFIRQVLNMDEIPDIQSWLSCSEALCPIHVQPEGRIEDSGRHTMHIDFANQRLGGGVLHHARVQEEIRFCTSPECIVGMLFMESMQANEAIIIKGFETVSDYTGYASSFRCVGFHKELQPAGPAAEGYCLAAIDATSFSRQHKEGQYQGDLLLRELNKALVGFLQPQACWLPTTQHASREPVLQQFCQQLSRDILHTAMEEAEQRPQQWAVTDWQMLDGGGIHIDALGNCQPRMSSPGHSPPTCSQQGSHLQDRAVKMVSSASPHGATGVKHPSSSLSFAQVALHSENNEVKGQEQVLSSTSHNEEFSFPSYSETCVNSNYDVYYFQQNWAKIMDLATHFVDQVLEDAKMEFVHSETRKLVPQISVDQYEERKDTIEHFADNLSNSVISDAMDKLSSISQISSDVLVSTSEASSVSEVSNVETLNDAKDENISLHNAPSHSDNELLKPLRDYADKVVQTAFGDAWERLEELARFPPEAGLYEEQLLAFATDFVQDVMDSAILEAEGFSYITRVSKFSSFQSNCSTEKSDSDYFMEEFCHSPRKPSLSVEDLKSFNQDLARRSSNEEVSDTLRRDSCGFRDSLLASFASELIRSNPNSPSLEMFETARRGSRDSLLTRRSSGGSLHMRRGSSNSLATRRSSGGSEVGFGSSPRMHGRYLAASPMSFQEKDSSGPPEVVPNISLDGTALSPSYYQENYLKEDEQLSSRSHSDVEDYTVFNCSKRIVSFEDISNRDTYNENHEEVAVSVENLNRSHEAILEWFSASRRTSDADLSFMSSTSQSAHIEWFVEDLLVEAFRAAFHDLFGDSYIDYCFTKSDSYLNANVSSDVAGAGDMGKFAEGFVKSVMQEAVHIAGSANVNMNSVYDEASSRIIENLSENITNEIMQEALQQTDSENANSWNLRRRPVATGNWGCGAFKGDPQLKALLQWLAASRAHIPSLLYYTFHNPQMTQLARLTEQIAAAGWSVADLMQRVLAYGQSRQTALHTGDTSQDLFAYIENCLQQSKC